MFSHIFLWQPGQLAAMKVAERVADCHKMITMHILDGTFEQISTIDSIHGLDKLQMNLS